MPRERGELPPAIVIDGDRAPAVGVAGDDAPRAVLSAPDAVAADGTLRVDVMEPVWRQAYAEVGADPRRHPVLVTESALGRRENREAIARTMFERLDVPSLTIARRALLVLHATGRATGVAVVLSDDVREIVPVHDGFALLASVIVLPPDEPVDAVLYLTPDCIVDCDPELRDDLFAGVVLAGAGALADGLAEELRARLRQAAPRSTPTVEVIAPADRRHLSWLGGARLTARADHARMYMTRADYAEHGASYVHRHCY